MIGQNIAHYRVTAKLGAGGMGEVYRATDTRLGRDVALKVLPETFAADAQRMQRFQREAQVLASLNHPNIAAIYGIEQQENTQALAMELVEGPTLAECITQGAIPLEEALPMAKQIAEAVEYAHERGIIHRDLKPANIKIAKDGQVKVLDFGLAKALAEDPAVPEILNSPTLSVAATRAGLILGTAAYMSPEQARGKLADRRADVWSFGAVLYEMLSGVRAFAGEDVSVTLANVIKEDPDWANLPAKTPHRIGELLRRCLTKDPRQRLQAIGEARVALEKTLANPEEPAAIPATNEGPGRPVWKRVLPWAIALLGILLAGATLWRPLPKSSNPVARFMINLPAETTPSADVRPNVAISPDGQLLAFVLSRLGVSRIYVRRIDALEAAPVPSTEGATNPFFSPDGQWLGYFAGGKLQKLRLSGGSPVTLAAAIDSRGAAWMLDDTILYSPIPISPLWRVSASGGAPQPFSRLEENKRERTHRWPCALPDGNAVLFTVGTTDSAEFYDDSEIDAVILATGERKKVLQGARMVQCLGAPGYLIYAREGILFGVRFDQDRLSTSGKPVPLVQGVMGEMTTGASNFALSGNGTLFHIPGEQAFQERTLAFWDSSGKATPLPAPPRMYLEPTLSPDGQFAAVDVTEGKSTDVWIYDLKRNTLNRLTFGPNCYAPIWSADGRRVIYRKDTADGKMALASKRADGTGDEEVLLRGERRVFPNSASPDGKWLLLDVQDEVQIVSDVFLLPLVGEPKPQPFITGPNAEFLSSFSPDGKWIAYQSNETGRFEIYVKPFPSGAGRWQVSPEGGEEAKWSPSGKEIIYRTGTRFLSVPVEADGTFRVGRPRVILESGPPLVGASSGKSYSVSADGKRLLTIFNLPRKEQTQLPLVVTVNWVDEVLRGVAQQPR